jgi:hypothetical protein
MMMMMTIMRPCNRPRKYTFRNKRKFGWIGHTIRKDDG